MAYSPLPAKVATDTLTLTNYNAIKGNFEVGVPDIFTTKGDLAAGTGGDAAARVAVGDDDSVLLADSSQSAGLAWQTQPAARVYNNAAIDPAPGGWVSLTFNSERYDTDAAHSTAVNSSRLTVPTAGDGIYAIGACLELNTDGLGGAGATVGIQILLNGTTVLARQMINIAPDGYDAALSISTFYSLAATNYVEVQVYTSANVDVNCSANYSPEFWLHWQRRA